MQNKCCHLFQAVIVTTRHSKLKSWGYAEQSLPSSRVCFKASRPAVFWANGRVAQAELCDLCLSEICRNDIIWQGVWLGRHIQ